MTTAALERARRWRPPPLIANPVLRWSILGLGAAYLYLAVSGIPVNWARVSEGMERGGRFVAGFLQPNFTSRFDEIFEGFVESLVMTVGATVLGLAVAVPVALGGARHLAPRPVYYFCRGLIALSRTFQEIIVAILFVAMFGFGPFAGACSSIKRPRVCSKISRRSRKSSRVLRR